MTLRLTPNTKGCMLRSEAEPATTALVEQPEFGERTPARSLIPCLRHLCLARGRRKPETNRWSVRVMNFTRHSRRHSDPCRPELLIRRFTSELGFYPCHLLNPW
jgi:hypothetical protein